jgi:integrase
MKARESVWSGDRGQGSIFHRLAGGKRESANLYLSYRVDGRECVVSAHTDDVAEAKRELRRLLRNKANAAEGLTPLVTPKTERVTVADVLAANLERAEAKGLADLKGIGYMTGILTKLLGSIRVVQLRPEHIDAYTARRKRGEGSKRGRSVGPAGVHRELEVLRKALRHAVERGVLVYAPHVPMPDVHDNVRDVEIPLPEFPRILAAIDSDDVRDFVEWLLTATRPKGVRGLKWSWFDAKTWTLRVPAEKGGSARQFAIVGTLRTIIERRIARRQLGCDLIFHRDGEPMRPKRTRKAFYRALKACGLPTGKESGYVLYDLKKTGVGLLLDAGLSDAEAMDFTGHRTASMLHRYRAKTAKRHAASVAKRDAYLEKQFAHISGGFAHSR